MTGNASLKTRLILLLSLLFLALALALAWASLASTRDFLARQLASHAQDAATTLSMRLQPFFSPEDPAGIANTVDALFDSGYFKSIRVANGRGDRMLERTQAVKVEGVPAWFLERVPLTAPPGQGEINTGWRLAGKVAVESHPGLAYRQLWNTALSTLGISFAGWLLASLLAMLTVASALRPLSGMEKLARRVAKGEFPRLEREPRVRELRHIGLALDDMSQSLERMLGEKSRLIAGLEQELNRDPVTGLANRRTLLAALAASMEGQDNSHALLIIGRIAGFSEYNQRAGRTAGDNLLRSLASHWRMQGRDGLAARLDGPQFALLTSTPNVAAARELLQGLVAACQRAAAEAGLNFNAGAGFAQDLAVPFLWLARVDGALRQAETETPGTGILVEPIGLDSPDMAEDLASLLEHGHLSLDQQPVASCADGGVLIREGLARLDSGGRRHSVKLWLNEARVRGILSRLDRLSLQAAAEFWDRRLAPDGSVSVNVAADSLLSGEAATWLADLPLHSPELCRHLFLEVNLDALRSPTLAAPLHRLRQNGIGLVVDRFNLSPDSLELLAQVRPDWIKLDAAITRTLEHTQGNRLMLTALCEYARGLKIRTCACGVENDSLLKAVREAGFDAAQGHAVGRPEPV